MQLPELEWNLEDYLRALPLHRGLILLMTLAFGGLRALHVAQQPNIYQASARILIEAQPPQLLQFREVVPYTTGAWAQGFLQTEYRIITSPDVLNRVVENLNLAGFPPFSRSDDPASVLQEMVSVQPIRGTKLVDAVVTSTKPELAAQMANGVADAYARLNLERRQELTTGGAQWLKDEVVKVEQKMKTAQLALQQFKEQHQGLPVGKEALDTTLQRLEQLNTAVTDAKKQRIEAETKYRSKHPVLLELQAKGAELEAALKEQEQLVLQTNRLAIEYNNLAREAATSESIYNALLTRLKELSVQEGLQTNNVQVVSYAKVPKGPIKPKRGLAVFLALLWGFFTGSSFSILWEALTNTKTIRSRREFEQVLEIPFLGHVPTIRLSKEHRGNESLLLLTEPQSVASEAIRAIRTTLEFLLPPTQSHVLLVTSALPEEGKSLISLNLAIALKELGRKVLLMDADMRRPRLHHFFHLNLEPGLSNYLQGQAEAGELVQMTATDLPLAIIPAGMTPPQPADLLASPKMRELIQKLREEYQVIFLDSPPVLAVADTTALANHVDGVIYVLWSGRTHRDAAFAGRTRLIDVGAKIVGGILNGVRPEESRGYQYRYYYSKRPLRQAFAS